MKVRLAFTLLLVIASVYFSATFYQTWVATSTANPSALPNSHLVNPIRFAQSQNLAIQANQLRYSLEYMVWPNERKRLEGALIAKLKQQLDLEPWNSQAWLHLLAVMSKSPQSHSEYLWVLNNTLALNEWHDIRKIPLAYYCLMSEVTENLLVTENLYLNCQQVIARINSAQLRYKVLSHFRLSQKEFDYGLGFYGLKQG